MRERMGGWGNKHFNVLCNNFVSLYFRSPCLNRSDGRGECSFLSPDGRGDSPAGGEQPDCGGGQFRHPIQQAVFFVKY